MIVLFYNTAQTLCFDTFRFDAISLLIQVPKLEHGAGVIFATLQKEQFHRCVITPLF